MNSSDTYWQRRYGTDEVWPGPAWNDVLATLLSHRSIRSFQSRALEAGTLEAIIAAAQSASTSSHLQAWSVIAVEDAGKKARLAQLAGRQKHVAECPMFLVWLADLARLEALGQHVGLPTRALDWTELFVLAVIDAALAAQNAVTAAESLGLGTVYIGGARNQPEAMAQELNLPPRVFPVFGLCLGFPEAYEKTQIKPRLPQSTVLHRETYQPAAWSQNLKSYHEAMALFYKEQGMAVKGSWSEHVSERVSGPEKLSGRDRLVEALHNLGFPLL